MIFRPGYFFGTRLLIFFWAVVLAIIWYLLIQLISIPWFQKLSLLSEGVYLLSPNNYFLAIPAFFLGFISADIPMRFFSSTYSLMPHLKPRTGIIFAVVIYAIGFGFVGLTLGTYTIFTKDSIVMNQFLSLQPISYPYSKIKSIKSTDYFTAVTGRKVYRPHFVIEFDDGFKWNSRSLNYGRDPDPLRDAEIIRFVVSRNGVSVISEEN